MKPSPGPWHVHSRSVWAVNPDGKTRFILQVRSGVDEFGIRTPHLELEDNAELIAEAGTVFHETGMTPRQLADLAGKKP